MSRQILQHSTHCAHILLSLTHQGEKSWKDHTFGSTKIFVRLSRAKVAQKALGLQREMRQSLPAKEGRAWVSGRGGAELQMLARPCAWAQSRRTSCPLGMLGPRDRLWPLSGEGHLIDSTGRRDHLIPRTGSPSLAPANMAGEVAFQHSGPE